MRVDEKGGKILNLNMTDSVDRRLFRFLAVQGKKICEKGTGYAAERFSGPARVIFEHARY